MRTRFILAVALAVMLPGCVFAAISPGMANVHSSDYDNGFAGSSVWSNGVRGVSVVGAGVSGYGFNSYGGYFESRDGMALKAYQHGQLVNGNIWAAKVFRGQMYADNEAAVLFVANGYDWNAYQTCPATNRSVVLLQATDVGPGGPGNYSMEEPAGDFKFVNSMNGALCRVGGYNVAGIEKMTGGFEASVPSYVAQPHFFNFLFQQTFTNAIIYSDYSPITLQANVGGNVGQVITLARTNATIPTLTVTNLIYAGGTARAPVDPNTPVCWLRYLLPDGTEVFTRGYR